MFIKLKDHKILGSVYDPAEEKDKVDEIDSLAPYMNDEVIEVENFTIKDLMDYLVEHEKETNVLFYASTNGHRIRPFYDDLQNQSDDKNNKLDEIEIGRSGHIFSHEDDDLVEHINYNVTTYATGVDHNDPEETYAFDFSPLGDLKDCTVRLNTSLHVYDMDMVRMPEKKYYCGEKPLSLRDIIDAFLREITFDGYPETKKERYNEMVEQLGEAEEDIKVAETFTPDELHLCTLDAKLNRLVEKEKYEEADVIRQRISDLEEKIKNEKGKVSRPFNIKGYDNPL